MRFQGNQTVCTCPATADNRETLTATLSEAITKLEIHCKSPLKCAPNQLQGTTVCPSTTDNLAACKTSTETADCMNVNTLLVLSSATVGWADREADGEQAKALTIKKENLPYVDGSFRVGCMDQSANETKCTVDVKVAARASATEGQKAICAYGRESNAKKQEVTLSSARNSFTLVCGDKGEIVQASYKVAHCPVGKGEEAAENCKEDHKTILPDYQEGWWTEENNKSITMKIPEDKFPEQDGSFMVPCQKAKNSDDKERPNALQDGSVCTVDVRILGVGKPSSSFPSPAVATGVSVFVIGAELLALAAPAGANSNSGATHSDAGHCAVIL